MTRGKGLEKKEIRCEQFITKGGVGTILDLCFFLLFLLRRQQLRRHGKTKRASTLE